MCLENTLLHTTYLADTLLHNVSKNTLLHTLCFENTLVYTMFCVNTHLNVLGANRGIVLLKNPRYDGV